MTEEILEPVDDVPIDVEDVKIVPEEVAATEVSEVTEVTEPTSEVEKAEEVKEVPEITVEA